MVSFQHMTSIDHPLLITSFPSILRLRTRYPGRVDTGLDNTGLKLTGNSQDVQEVHRKDKAQRNV